MNDRFIIVSKEAGVFLGECLGMLFWSELDAVGQGSAISFVTRQRADDLVAENPEAFPMDDINIIPVKTSDLYWASMAECMLSGVKDWTRNL